jgi:transmembrane sensor
VDSVSLPDGSQVVLAPGSRLAVAAGYGGTHRELRLDGVARFTVRHDAARPFVVRVADAEVRDLGTVFTVRRRVGGDVAVAVTEGVVALRGARAAAADPGVVLDAGDRGTVAADGQVAVERGGAAAEDLGWTEGRLAFRDAPLDEVREGLRRWFGVTLRVDDPALAGRHLTASFQGEPLARVREVLALALGATAELRGDTLVLRRATMARGTAR